MIKKIFTLLCLCTLCIGSAWGDEIVLTAEEGFPSAYGTTSIRPEGFDGVGIMYNGKNQPSGFAAKQLIQFRKTDGCLYNTEAISNISSVKVYLQANNAFSIEYSDETKLPEKYSNSISTSDVESTSESVEYTNTSNTKAKASAVVYTFDLSESKPSFINIKNGSKAIYVYKIVITYSKAQDVEITSAGWATACLPFNATITSGNATAYYVTTSDGALNKIEANVIPANEGVLLKSNDGGEATVTFTPSTETADDVTTIGNFMKGSVAGETFNATGFKYYILANDKNLGLGFYFQVAEGVYANCAAGKAVLAVPTDEAGAKTGFPFDEEPTGISESMVNGQSTAVYNLNGMKVDKNYNGIVIMNGKKYLNK